MLNNVLHLSARRRDLARRADEVVLSPVGTSADDDIPPSRSIRLNVIMDAEVYRESKELFGKYGVRIADMTRAGLAILRSAIPHLTNGGKLILQQADGQHFEYSFPGLACSSRGTQTKKRAGGAR